MHSSISSVVHRPHASTSAALQSTLSAHLAVKKPENDATNKPTILDIISETEKNQTKMNAPRFTQQADVLNHRSNSVGHPGVAEPLTWQQLEREMSSDQKMRDTSTSKEGISTWILLSGSDKQTSSASTTSSPTTISNKVDKLEVQAPAVTEPPKRNNFRFQESYQAQLVDKIGKLREAIERRQNKPEKRTKPTVSSTVGTTTTLTTSTATEAAESTPSTTEKKVQRRKNPSFMQIGKVNKQKHNRTTTTSTTTTTTAATTEKPQEDEMTTIVSYIQGMGSSSSSTSEDDNASATTAVPFLVLEPKDADFDLPQDRSPGPAKKNKRPNPATKLKKKNGNKHVAASTSNPNKKNPNTKVALNNKLKEKPMTTKIYNYLSREVMPTVGVGLVGLVVTAGLASYFFGPLGALRRSYDDAMDRQDTNDNMYAVNSDEYAAGNPEAGQNEEEVFGKFIAGMPANYMPKYVRYYQPHGPHQAHAQPGPVHGPHGPHGPHPYPGTRRVYAQPTGGPKYGPQQQYFRNRNGAEATFSKVSPSPHYQQQQYQQQQPALRNHQPQPQQPLASPYLQQLHDLQMQKSLTTNIESALKQHTFEGESNPEFKAVVPDDAPAAAAIVKEEVTTDVPVSIVTASNPENLVDIDATNQIQRRIAHYVVGSVQPVSKPEPSEIPQPEASASVVSSPEILTATHGPRRRRSLRKRRDADLEARVLQSRANVESELGQIDELFKQLQGKIDQLNSNDTEKLENAEKINKEFKRSEDNVKLLHMVVDHIKDIEKFQKEFYIKSKNWELAMTLKTGMNHIRKQIGLVSDLIDHPADVNLIRRIEQSDTVPSETSTTAPIDGAAVQPPADGTSAPAHFSPLDDLFKLIQLKALFGINILQNIRPSFERAFEEVFRMPAKEKFN